MNELLTMRLDKWLWCARFYKTRSLAVEEIGKGRVTVNGLSAKAGRELKIGDTLVLRQGPVARTVVVRGLMPSRGPASVAQGLYTETPESIAERERLAEQRRLAPEPADALIDGRPTKRDRRSLDKAQGSNWNSRWSASADK